MDMFKYQAHDKRISKSTSCTDCHYKKDVFVIFVLQVLFTEGFRIVFCLNQLFYSLSNLIVILWKKHITVTFYIQNTFLCIFKGRKDEQRHCAITFQFSTSRSRWVLKSQSNLINAVLQNNTVTINIWTQNLPPVHLDLSCVFYWMIFMRYQGKMLHWRIANIP